MHGHGCTGCIGSYAYAWKPCTFSCVQSGYGGSIYWQPYSAYVIFGGKFQLTSPFLWAATISNRSSYSCNISLKLSYSLKLVRTQAYLKKPLLIYISKIIASLILDLHNASLVWYHHTRRWGYDSDAMLNYFGNHELLVMSKVAMVAQNTNIPTCM